METDSTLAHVSRCDVHLKLQCWNGTVKERDAIENDGKGKEEEREEENRLWGNWYREETFTSFVFITWCREVQEELLLIRTFYWQTFIYDNGVATLDTKQCHVFFFSSLIRVMHVNTIYPLSVARSRLSFTFFIPARQKMYASTFRTCILQVRSKSCRKRSTVTSVNSCMAQGTYGDSVRQWTTKNIWGKHRSRKRSSIVWMCFVQLMVPI